MRSESVHIFAVEPLAGIDLRVVFGASYDHVHHEQGGGLSGIDEGIRQISYWWAWAEAGRALARKRFDAMGIAHSAKHHWMFYFGRGYSPGYPAGRVPEEPGAIYVGKIDFEFDPNAERPPLPPLPPPEDLLAEAIQIVWNLPKLESVFARGLDPSTLDELGRSLLDQARGRYHEKSASRLRELGVVEVRPFLRILMEDGELETFKARMAELDPPEDLADAARTCTEEEHLPFVAPLLQAHPELASAVAVSATGKGANDALRLALEADADPDHRGNGNPMTWEAAQRRDAETMRLLLAAGADMHATEPNWRSSAPEKAVTQGAWQVVEVLLEFGLDPNRPNEDGMPLFAYAAWQGKKKQVLEVMLAGPKRVTTRSLRKAWKSAKDKMRPVLQAEAEARKITL